MQPDMPLRHVVTTAVGGGLVLVGFAFIYHRLTWPGLWPRSWWS